MAALPNRTLFKYSTLIIFAISSAFVTLTTSAEELVFVNDSSSYCPYTLCEDGKEGYIIEVVKAIYRSEGYTVTIKNVPWNRAIAMVNAGTANGILGIVKKDSPELVYPQTEVARYVPVVYSLVSNPWHYEGINSLRKIRLGLIQNYGDPDSFPELKAYLEDKSSQVSYVATDNSLLHLFMMIEVKHIDATIDDQRVGTYLLRKSGKEKLFKSESFNDLAGSGFVAFTSKNAKSQHLADLFDEGMAKLRKSGKLKSILTDYGIADWSK